MLVILFLDALVNIALGTISPIMAKYALEETDKIGTTGGSIYAAGLAGSIIGTFFSGFVLVPPVGNPHGNRNRCSRVSPSHSAHQGKRRIATAAAGTLCALLFFLAAHPHAGLSVFEPGSNTISETDSMYSHITVKDQADGERVYREAAEAFLAARAAGSSPGEELRTITSRRIRFLFHPVSSDHTRVRP